MSDDLNKTKPEDHEEFASAAEDERTGLLVEFWDFLKHNKKWWLLPILIVLVLIAALALLASNPAAAPFIYPLF